MFQSYDKKYLKIAMPAALEGLFMILLASADLIMVGTLGAVSIAAVSIFLQPRLVILCFTRSLASSVTLLVSRDAGRNDRTNSSDILKKSIFIGAIILLMIHTLFYIFLEDIFYLMGAKPDYMTEALAYGNIALFSVFISSFTLFLQAVQLGFGQTAVIMKTNILANIVNVIMNFILIFGMGPIPAMGVAGAAIGTVISTIFGLCWTIFLMKKDNFLQGGSFIPDKAYFQKVTPIFLSVFSEQGFERIGMVLFTRMAASLGTIPFAVHSICMNIADIYWDYIVGFGKASMVTAGQSIGKKSEAEWHAFKRAGIKWTLICSTIAFTLTAVFREEIFSFYSSDPEALAMSGFAMFICAVVNFPAGHALVCAGILRGSGKTASVAAYAFISITILRPLITAFFLFVMEWGLVGAWSALLIDQCIRATCSTVLLHRLQKSGWNKIIEKSA